MCAQYSKTIQQREILAIVTRQLSVALFIFGESFLKNAIGLF